MEKLSRSVRRAKQAKKNDADCTCPFMRGTWPYGPPCAQHLRAWGLIPLTVRHFAPFSGTRVGAGFWHGKRSELGSLSTGANGEPVTELEERKNGSKHNLMSF
jgi:hypothetical protein